MKTLLSILLILNLSAAAVIGAEDDPLAAPEMKKFAKGAVELGWKYFNKGDYETALKRFEMATRHDKTYASGYFGMAYVYSVEGKMDEAIKYYRETLKYNQAYPYTYANLGLALLHKEQFEEALKMLDQALKLDPKCAEAHFSYAQYYASKDRWPEAGASANRAIENGLKLPPEFRQLLEKNGAKLKTETNAPAVHGIPKLLPE
jgi:Tfp pilus assembly protein PilF